MCKMCQYDNDIDMLWSDIARIVDKDTFSLVVNLVDLEKERLLAEPY